MFVIVYEEVGSLRYLVYVNYNVHGAWAKPLDVKLDKVFLYETEAKAQSVINKKHLKWGEKTTRNLKVKSINWLKRGMIQEALR